MTINVTGDPVFPDPEERAALNAALIADNIETGFWDDRGRPAPWPDDFAEWTTVTSRLATHEPDEPPF